MRRLAGILFIISFGCITPDSAAEELTDLSFDDLMQIEVTSVSKKAERLSQAAAAVYIVTQNEIRRSGATSIPEALRLVPGVHVAQIDPNKWAIGIRGFNGRLANKLLVLMDGRSLYTPTYSGVYWEHHDYVMADIERIEVIRGPGATLWGTNAVNGVINIITKEAGDTTDGLARVAVGNELRGLASVRQGKELSERSDIRVYAKGKKLDGAISDSGADQDNGGGYLQSGFRYDWQDDYSQWLTVQGDLYHHDLSQEHDYLPAYSAEYTKVSYQGNVKSKGGNLMGRWTQVTGLDSELSVSLWYDYYLRQEVKYDDRLDSIDFNIQHKFSPWHNHEIVWGGGYRWNESNITNGGMISVTSSKQTLKIWNLFIQDEITFPKQDLSVTLGTKVESNDYSDVEVQPNIRASWVPGEQMTLWGAVSRAKRIPSRGETDFIVDFTTIPPSGPYTSPQVMRVYGNDTYDSEQLDAYELGVRWMPQQNLALDLALFYNDYKNLRSYVLDTPYLEGDVIILPLALKNTINGYSQGGELLATWQATEYSRYKLTYSYIDIKLNYKGSESYFSDLLISMDKDRTPQNQLSLWASYDLSPAWELDIRVFYKDDQSWDVYPDELTTDINAYTNADIRIGWQPRKSLLLSLTGHNILHNEQHEFTSESWAMVSRLERSLYADITLKW